jgi:hypothetical protein
MAIECMPFITLILRVNVQQEISAKSWKFLMYYSDPNTNFDGEIMVFGAMSGQDIQQYVDRLSSFGFVEPNNGDHSDMVIWEGPFGATSDIPEWLTTVSVEFFDERTDDIQAWKLTDSGEYNLLDFHSTAKLPMKGYECDWEPKIGKIGSSSV